MEISKLKPGEKFYQVRDGSIWECTVTGPVNRFGSLEVWRQGLTGQCRSGKDWMLIEAAEHYFATLQEAKDCLGLKWKNRIQERISMEISTYRTKIILQEETLHIDVEADGQVWSWDKDYVPRMLCEEGEIPFSSAEHITHETIENGVGKGIQTTYEGFWAKGNRRAYSFATLVWVECATEQVFFEWIPLKEEGLCVEKVLWPGPMAFEEKRPDWYTLLNHQQGILIPNDWETELGPLPFDGFFGTAGGYMPWFGQVRGRAGYLAICTTPWNAGYQAEHPAGGPYTHVSVRYEPSLGRIEYRRILRYSFWKDCDYNDICKEYRRYVKEQGKLCTLVQKAAKTPQADKLIGCAFVHTGIKTQVQPDSAFYDPGSPDKNNRLTTFAKREKEMKYFHDMGVKKLYLHLDGWAQPGYDNCHPDYFPACKEAGGWEGMKSLADQMHEWGYLLGIHDQYRDYYFSAPSFDENYACRLADGRIPSHRQWAGGPQSYLCATQAPFYVRRNFAKIREQGIRLDAAYLDVFTCNEGDECSNSMHKMTRKECCEYRLECFEYLLSNEILPSSEEVSDWSLQSLVFCHYAPYDFMMRKPGAPKHGIPVPLFNLVYHDCVIIPWMMDKVSEDEDYMLYALLNGGAPYLVREGAYPDTDGSFALERERQQEQDIERSRIVSRLHEKVAKCEMIRHEMIGEGGLVQRTVFADKTEVTVDFRKQTYKICWGEEQQ